VAEFIEYGVSAYDSLGRNETWRMNLLCEMPKLGTQANRTLRARLCCVAGGITQFIGEMLRTGQEVSTLVLQNAVFLPIFVPTCNFGAIYNYGAATSSGQLSTVTDGVTSLCYEVAVLVRVACMRNDS
jgi:hypothetical protein